jgi:peptidoglycan/LPS O-acetylase OafA/YrhL
LSCSRYLGYPFGLPMANLQQSGEHLRALTSLRFVAAAAILTCHTWPRGPDEPGGLVQLGTGVTFFFILSGFILTHTYLNSLRTLSLRGIWNFYVARAARIWPVHLLALALVLPFFFTDLWSGKHGDPVFKLATTAALVQTFVLDGRENVLNPPSWSLSAELFFYLCFPILILGLSRGMKRRVIVLCLCLTPWALAVIRLSKIVPVNPAFAYVNSYFFPPVRIIDFISGMLLGFCWQRRHTVETAGCQSSILKATLGELGAVVLLAAWACLWTRLAPSPGQSYAVSWAGVYITPFMFCIWVFAAGRGALSKLLSARPLVYLGEISYGIYMFHFPVMLYFPHTAFSRRLHRWCTETLGWPGLTLSVAIVTIMVSAACYHFYEMPLRDFIRRKLALRKPPVLPALEKTPPPLRTAA